MKTQTAFDIKGMAKLTGVPVFALKEVLGIPLEECTAKTLAEAKNHYLKVSDATPISNASEEAKETLRAARKKWEELSLADVEAAVTIEEIIAALENAHGTKARAIALKKLLGFLITFPELKSLYEKEMYQGGYNEEAHPIILEKLLSVTSTSAEFQSVYDLASENASRKEEALVYAQWEKFSLGEVGRADTPHLAYEAWEACPYKSGVQTLALNKLEQLCSKEIESAAAPETIADLLVYMPEESELRSVALIKIAVLLGYTG